MLSYNFPLKCNPSLEGANGGTSLRALSCTFTTADTAHRAHTALLFVPLGACAHVAINAHRGKHLVGFLRLSLRHSPCSGHGERLAPNMGCSLMGALIYGTKSTDGTPLLSLQEHAHSTPAYISPRAPMARKCPTASVPSVNDTKPAAVERRMHHRKHTQKSAASRLLAACCFVG